MLKSIFRRRDKERDLAKIIGESKEVIEKSHEMRGTFIPLSRSTLRTYISFQIRRLDERIKSNPNESILYFVRASLLNEIGRYPEAKEDLERVSLNDGELVKRAFDYGIDLKRGFFEQLSFAEFNVGNYDVGAEYFIKRIMGEDISRDTLESKELQHYVKGIMFKGIKKEEEARKEFKGVLSLSPNLDSESLRKFSESQENDHPAVIYLRRKDAFFAQLGYIEEKLGNLENALQYYEKSLEINPEQPLSNEQLPHLKEIVAKTT